MAKLSREWQRKGVGEGNTWKVLQRTYVHSYSFHKSTQSKGSGQMTLEHGRFDGQLRSTLRAMVACPHWVPFMAGGSGRCLPSSLQGKKERRKQGEGCKNGA